MAFGPARAETFDLGYDQLLVLRDRRGARVQVLYGGLWLTEEGDRHDHFLLAGDEVTLDGAGMAVMQALGPCRLAVCEPSPRPFARRGLALLRRLAGRLRRPGRRGACAEGAWL